MNPVCVVEWLERIERPFQIGSIPEQNLVEIPALDGSDQPLDNRVRGWHAGYRFDFLDAEDLKIGSPSVKRKQRVIIGARILRRAYPGNGLDKHPAKRLPIDVPGLDRKSDNFPSELIHDRHHPRSGRLRLSRRGANVAGLACPRSPVALSGI